MQHHLVDLLRKDGVYERRKTIETFSLPEIRDLEPLEVRAVVACEIGRAFGKPHSCIRCLLLPRRGIPPAGWLVIASSLFIVNAANPMLMRSRKATT